MTPNIPEFPSYHLSQDGVVYKLVQGQWKAKSFYNYGQPTNFYKFFKNGQEFFFSVPELLLIVYGNGFDDEKTIIFIDNNPNNLTASNIAQPSDKDEYLIKYPLENFEENLIDYPGYHITRDGILFSRKNAGGRALMERFWRKLKPTLTYSGYVRYPVYLRKGSAPKNAHQLVAEAYLHKSNENLIVCHNDGNKLNNTVENLRWDTPKSNTADRIKHGTMHYGEDSSLAKYSNEYIVQTLEEFVKSDKTLKQFTKNLNISHQGLRHIINEEVRLETNIPELLIKKARDKVSHSGKKLSPDKIIQIFQNKKNGLSIQEIAIKFDIHYQMAFSILKRKCWKKVVIPQELLT